MKVPLPVLRPVKKAKQSVTTSFSLTSDELNSVQSCERAVNEKLLADIRTSLTTLPTCSSRVINTAVHQHLTAPTTDNAMLLDGWEKCGRGDFQRKMPVKFRHIEKEVFTALGIACLIRYARGYLDEAEAAVAKVQRRD